MIGWLLLFSCGKDKVGDKNIAETKKESTAAVKVKLVFTKPFAGEIKVKNFFSVLDSILAGLDSTLDYKISEHVLVHANPWILDSLTHTDYYYNQKRGRFIEDPNDMIVIGKGDSLRIPGVLETKAIQKMLDSTRIDVNIPEYVMRIIRERDTLYTFSVRVGMDRRRYLEMAGREVSLRTPVGQGEIVRVQKDPWFINPVDGKRYHATRRDDGKYTKLPIIPWIEPSVNGLRPGSLIHPTTNLATLGKSYSNGCVGASEADSWRIYYHAPLGTRINFRYDLVVVNAPGDTSRLKDIYHLGRK